MASTGRKKKAFTEEETSVLLDIWADDRIQEKFNNSFRHNLIWEDIALRMRGMGYNRSWKECYNRVGNLKKIFARKKRDFETGMLFSGITIIVAFKFCRSCLHYVEMKKYKVIRSFVQVKHSCRGFKSVLQPYLAFF